MAIQAKIKHPLDNMTWLNGQFSDGNEPLFDRSTLPRAPPALEPKIYVPIWTNVRLLCSLYKYYSKVDDKVDDYGWSFFLLTNPASTTSTRLMINPTHMTPNQPRTRQFEPRISPHSTMPQNATINGLVFCKRSFNSQLCNCNGAVCK